VGRGWESNRKMGGAERLWGTMAQTGIGGKLETFILTAAPKPLNSRAKLWTISKTTERSQRVHRRTQSRPRRNEGEGKARVLDQIRLAHRRHHRGGGIHCRSMVGCGIYWPCLKKYPVGIIIRWDEISDPARFQFSESSAQIHSRASRYAAP
jgi:hypothetical protein